MYQTLLNRLREALAATCAKNIRSKSRVVLERPPKLELGEAASPLCFELAKRLKKAPRMIAQEIAKSLPKIDGIARVEVAGGGYLNAFFDRADFWNSSVGRESIVDTLPCQVWSCYRRAHQHQSQQSRAHRSPAQRRTGRHHGAPTSP